VGFDSGVEVGFGSGFRVNFNSGVRVGCGFGLIWASILWQGLVFGFGFGVGFQIRVGMALVSAPLLSVCDVMVGFGLVRMTLWEAL
jgi:hypothetical protein